MFILLLAAMALRPTACARAAGWPTVFGVHAQSKTWSNGDTGYLGKFLSIQAMAGPGAVIRDWWRWSEIEPAQGTHDWAQPDAAVARAQQMGQKLIVCLCDAPVWANGHPGDTTWPATDVNVWKGYLAEVVGRYKDRGAVIAWELWNEENTPTFFESGGTETWQEKAQDYGSKVLIPGYDAIKAADHGANVVLGGLTSNWFPDTPGGTPYEHSAFFLRHILQVAGAPERCDWVGFHPYMARTDYSSLPSSVGQIRAVMDAFGIGGKPLAFTEWGALPRDPLGEESQCNDFMQLAALQQKCGPAYACYHYVIDAEGVGYGLFDMSIPQETTPADWRLIAHAFNVYTSVMSGCGYLSDAAFVSRGSDDTVGYLFTKDGARVTAVWNYLGADQVQLQLAANTVSAKLVKRIGQVAQQTPLAIPGSGIVSLAVGSNPTFLVETLESVPPSSVGAAKLKGDGAPVNLPDVVVSAVLSGCFYVQQADRSSGIRVTAQAPTPSLGQSVHVTGRLDASGPELSVSQAEWTAVTMYPELVPEASKLATRNP